MITREGDVITQEDKEYILAQEKLERLIEEIVDRKIQIMWDEIIFFTNHR